MSSRLNLVLIPGLLCDADLWRAQINHLEDIANSTVPDTTHDDTIAGIAATILRTCPRHFALAGLSMGGYIAFEIMRQAPERVLKLALFDTSARADTPEQQERRRAMIALSRTGQFKGVTPRLLPLLVHPDHVGDAALTAVITGMADRIGRDAFCRQQTAIVNRIDSRPFLPHITCPVLAACGAQDAITPPAVMQEIADAIPGARFEVVEQSGHLLPLEQPQAVNRLMREWLV